MDSAITERLPLFNHHLDVNTAFSHSALVEAVRADRHLEPEPIPQVCVLEFDGDLTDWLASTGVVRSCKAWACFHTTMSRSRWMASLAVSFPARSGDHTPFWSRNR